MIWIKNYLKSRFGKVFRNKYLNYYLNKYIKMSDTPDERMTELSKKIGICNKNVKAMMEMVKTLTEKLDVKLANSSHELCDKPVEKTPEEKERIDKIFEARSVGRPRGSFEEKRKQYHKLLLEGKIKEPKEQTLLYYKIFKDMSNNTYILLD